MILDVVLGCRFEFKHVIMIYPCSKSGGHKMLALGLLLLLYCCDLCDCLQCQHFFIAFNMFLIVFTFRRAFEVVFRGLMSSVQNPPCFPPRDHPQAGHFNPTLQYRCVNGAVALFCWNQAAEEILLGWTTMNWEILYLVHTCI